MIKKKKKKKKKNSVYRHPINANFWILISYALILFITFSEDNHNMAITSFNENPWEVNWKAMATCFLDWVRIGCDINASLFLGVMCFEMYDFRLRMGIF